MTILRSAVCAVFAAAALSGAAISPAAAAEPSTTAGAKVCSARYIKALRMEEMMKSMMDGMVPAMMAAMPESDAVPADAKKMIAEIAVETTLAIVPDMIADMEPLMVKHFSEAEICAMADFYDSPAGQAIMDKMPAFTAESGTLTMKYIPKIQKELVERMCKRIDCDNPAAKKALMGAS